MENQIYMAQVAVEDTTVVIQLKEVAMDLEVHHIYQDILDV